MVTYVYIDGGLDSVWSSEEAARRRERASREPAIIVKVAVDTIAISGTTAIELPDL